MTLCIKRGTNTMLEIIKDYQTLIAAFLALIGASIVVYTTKSQINAARKQEEEKQLQEIRSLAAILAVESEMSLKSAGYVAAILYKNPGEPVDQDFNFQVFKDNLSSLGKLPGALPQQVMYCFNKVISLQELTKERAAAILQLSEPKEMDENIKRSTISAVDIAASAVVELAILTPWLERVAETGDSLSIEKALEEIMPAFERVHPIARELAAVKIHEVQQRKKSESEAKNA